MGPEDLSEKNVILYYFKNRKCSFRVTPEITIQFMKEEFYHVKNLGN
jgi:hypothetical protein